MTGSLASGICGGQRRADDLGGVLHHPHLDSGGFVGSFKTCFLNASSLDARPTNAPYVCHPQGLTWDLQKSEFMAIPGFSPVLAALLRLMDDGTERRVADTVGPLASQFGVTAIERQDTLPSGGRRLDNRIAWARSYLIKAGLLESPRRGYFRITELGRQALQDRPEGIDERYLLRYPQFAAWYKPSQPHPTDVGTSLAPKESEQTTPEEAIEEGYRKLQQALADELLERVHDCPPDAFERLVVLLLVAMGYGGSLEDVSAAVVGRPGDGGVDGIINQDPLGLDVVYIQAKRWQATVGEEPVRGFVGSLEGKRAQKGVFITTSGFSDAAVKYVGNIGNKVVLIDGPRLAHLMIQHGIGVIRVTQYPVQRADPGFFEDL